MVLSRWRWVSKASSTAMAVLEQVTIDLMDEVGVGLHLHRESLVPGGFDMRLNGKRHRIDLHRLTGGKNFMVYGQTEVTHDLIASTRQRATAWSPVHRLKKALPRCAAL